METEIPNDLMSLIEAGKLIQVSKGTIGRWVRLGKLPAFQIGSRFRVSRADVLAQVQRVQPAKGPAIPTRSEAAATQKWVSDELRRARIE